jgi:hypothetical protein
MISPSGSGTWTLRASFREEVGHLNVEGSGQLYDRGQRGAAFAAENLRQVRFREIRLKIEAVKRAVLLDDDLAQPFGGKEPPRLPHRACTK